MKDFNIKFFCEGVSDQRFLRDFIKVHYDIDISDKDLNDNNVIHKLNSFKAILKI